MDIVIDDVTSLAIAIGYNISFSFGDQLSA